jgi:hypothetical protein
MLQRRFLPPLDPTKQAVLAGPNILFRANLGGFVDTLGDPAAVDLAVSHGWIDVGWLGSSTDRPTKQPGTHEPLPVGFQFTDTDLGITLWWDGADWRDASSTVRPPYEPATVASQLPSAAQ